MVSGIVGVTEPGDRPQSGGYGSIFTTVHLPNRLKYHITEAPTSMPKVEINIPEHLEMQITQMVERGEFVNREEAIEDLLSTGLKAYKTSGPIEDDEPGGFEDDGMMGHEDEYVF